MRYLMIFAVCFAGSLATAQDASPLEEAQYLADVALAQGIETTMAKSVRAIVADRMAAALAQQNVRLRDKEELAARLPDSLIEKMLGDPKARTVDFILRTQNPGKIISLAQQIRENEAVFDHKPMNPSDPQQVKTAKEWGAGLKQDLARVEKSCHPP